MHSFNPNPGQHFLLQIIKSGIIHVGLHPRMPAPGLPNDKRSGEPIEISPDDLPPGIELPPLGPEGLPGAPPAGGGKIRMKKKCRRWMRGLTSNVLLNFSGSTSYSRDIARLLARNAACLRGRSLCPLIKLFGEAATTGQWNNVWSMTTSFYEKSPRTPARSQFLLSLTG